MFTSLLGYVNQTIIDNSIPSGNTAYNIYQYNASVITKFTINKLGAKLIQHQILE